MKKMIFSILIVLCITGCWNYKELNEYSIVTGIAIDKIKDSYKVSVLISNVQKNNGSDSNSTSSDVVVYEGSGKSIFEAFKDIGLISPKELYLNSFSILVISEDVAKTGINESLDFFLRYSSSRNNFDIVIAKDCLAKDTLKILTSITNSPSQNISDNLKTTTALQGAIKTVSFDDLTSILVKDGIEPTINTISIIGDIEEGSTKENLESSEPKAYIKLGNMAIFKNDKLIDFATHEESIGINIISNNVNELYFNLNYQDGFIIIDTVSFFTDIKTEVKNEIPYVNINMKSEAKIIETKGNINLEDIKVMEEIQEKANKKIISFVSEAINLSIKNNSDILGIERQFYMNNPNYYKKVKDKFSLNDINYNINSNIIINNKISSKNSLEDENDRQKN